MFHFSRIPYYMGRRGLLNWMSDEAYLKLVYRWRTGKKLNLENPVTFNEKLQWLKLYDRKPEYTMMADKYAVRKYIADTIGEEYLIPLLGVWEDPDEIDFDALPDQFVLKCNHNSATGLCICKDKSKLDIEKVKKELRKGLKENYFWGGREWQYKDIPRKIICEKYMDDGSGDALQDYKFFCFNGVPKLMYVTKEASTDPGVDFFDMDFNFIPLKMGWPNFCERTEKPKNFALMKEISAQLSKNIPILRVDFFEINGILYVGELTFFHSSGFDPITPNEYDIWMGNEIILPTQ